jgi:hypothetical protein
VSELTLTEIGQRMVRAGRTDSDSILEMAALGNYWRSERDRVAKYGQCASRCRSELVPNARNELVCPHTFLPCVSRSVAEIAKLWSEVNKR